MARKLRSTILLAALAGGVGLSAARGANQTTELSPIVIGGTLPFDVEIDAPLAFSGQTLPALHSFAAGTLPVGDHRQWLVLGGMTNGLHDLGGGGFDPASHNKSVYVIDPVTQQVWGRSLVGSGLTDLQISTLSSTNAQSSQVGSTLYVAGGYGNYTATNGDVFYTTFDTLNALHLPSLMNWVKTGTGNASDSLRQISDPALRVTGGDMHTTANGRTHLIFGQDYPEAYDPRLNGTYTHQVRSFSIVDDGTNLSLGNVVLHPTHDDFRRRDLNVVPIIEKANGQFVEKIQALSGVFTPSFGAWTLPVTIDDQGNAVQGDPDDPASFKQGMNGYKCATLGLYSADRDEMHTLLLGGISYQTYNPVTGYIEDDFNLPFTSNATDIVIDSAGNMTQYLLPDLFPEIIAPATGAPYLMGAETQFFLADGIATYSNGVIDLDALTGRTLVGYLYGGIAAEVPNGGPSVGSNALMPLWISPAVIPEPASGMALLTFALLGRHRRNRPH